MMKRSVEQQMSIGYQNMSSADAKKPRMEACNPSRVLHIRGVPAEASEEDIVQIGIPFGRMTNLVLARKKNQALLEMADISTAQTMFNYYHECPPLIKGQHVHIQYSNHQQLKTEQFLTGTSGVQNALKAASSQYSSNNYHHTSNYTAPPSSEEASMIDFNGGGGQRSYVGGGGGDAVGGNESVENNSKIVVRAVVENICYPITIDILHKVFSKYGHVDKIITFKKDNLFQALIQYSTALEAQGALQFLNNQNIYNGCCTLRLDYSKLPVLNVRFNNDRSWDYTNPNLGNGDHQSTDQHGDGILGPGTFGAIGAGNFGGMPSNFGMDSLPGPRMNGGGGGGGGQFGMQRSGNTGGGMMPSAGGHGGGMGGGGMCGMNAGMMGGGYMGSMHMRGGMMGESMGHGMRHMVPHGISVAPGGVQIPSGGGAGCVVIISGLDEERTTPDLIYSLFGSYGIVTAVKILYNKKDTALVQYNDPQQAVNAITYLNMCVLWGNTLKVSHSKHTHIQLPREGQGDGSLTKDFTNSPLNRFKKVIHEKALNITYPPTPTLHVGNMPPSTSEEELTDLFSEHGTIVQFKFLEKERKMALIELQTTEEAINALVALHNHLMPGNFHLRVSFTKSKIQ